MQYNSQQQRRIIPTEYFTIPLPVSTVIGRGWRQNIWAGGAGGVSSVSPGILRFSCWDCLSQPSCLSLPAGGTLLRTIDAFKPLMWLYNLMTQVQLTTLSLLHILRRCKYHVQSGHGRAGLTHLFKIVRADKFLSQVSSL